MENSKSETLKLVGKQEVSKTGVLTPQSNEKVTTGPLNKVALRVAVQDAIEQLVELLDYIDGDSDFEPEPLELNSDDDACDTETYGDGWTRVHVDDQREWGGL